MYIDIALTPFEERCLLAGFLVITFIGLVLLVRPRLFTRGLAPLVTLVTGRRRGSMSNAGVNPTLPSNAVFPLPMPGKNKEGTIRRPSLTIGWSKRFQGYKRTMLENPDEFGYGVVSYWPVPTWSNWTTYAPALGWLGKQFENELELRSTLELDAGMVSPLEEGERKGSVGLGIVGVDVSVTKIEDERKTVVSTANIATDQPEEKWSQPENAAERDGFFPPHYDMSVDRSIEAPIALLGAPTSPSNMERPTSPSISRRLTASSLPGLPEKEVEPELIPFTPFPKKPTRTSWKSHARTWLLFSYTRLAGPVCLVTMGLAIGVMCLQAGQSWIRVWKVVVTSRHDVTIRGNGLAKRSMGDGFQRLEVDSSEGYQPRGNDLVQALIPGWTVPWSHIFPIVGTLLVCQVIHEAGHVIAGAMDSIEPTRLALNLHLIVPAASVAFPKTVSDLVPSSRLRMAAAGPWNNLLTWAILSTIAATRMSMIFYHDYTAQGRVVLGIDSGSALSGHVPVGSIVEFLDDTRLSGERDTWSDYLMGDDLFDETRGWCIDKKRYLASTPAPCPPGISVEFTSLPSNASIPGAGAKSGGGMGVKRCLPAYPLLTSRTWACPCSSASKVCVRPVKEEKILRIQWRDPSGSGLGDKLGLSRGEGRRREEDGPVVVLWSGEKREVWEVVRVSRWVGRAGTIGRWVVGWFELVFNYAVALSLSLALLNVLPLPRLDGAHMMEAMLDRLYPTTKKSGGRALPTAASAPGHEAEDVIEQGLDPLTIEDEVAQSKRSRIEMTIGYVSVGMAVLALGGGVLASILESTLLSS